MYIRILPLLIFGFITITFADSAVQTSWSEGPEVLGPVIDWGNEFYQSSSINWSGYPGIALLMQSILEHTVDGDFSTPVSVHSADVNGDGYMDVLGTSGQSDKVTWWENVGGSGTSWTKHTVDGDFDGACSVFSSDVNGDGYLDVIGTALWANHVTWWENLDGSGTSWTEHTVDGDFDFARSVYSADINGDDFMDILGAARFANDITWWENLDGSGTSWTEHTVDGDYNSAVSVYSEDVNGDGYMDVLGAAFDDDDITWWENLDGSGTSWTEHAVDGDFNGAVSVYSEDVNGDGYMDVLGVSPVENDIIWWENLDGSGTNWTEHTVDGDFDGAWSVYSEDVNGDGYMDVLGAAYYADDITWWDLTAYVPDGSLESSILDTECSPQWASIDWSSSEPAGTDLYFQYRTSDNPGIMGSWSDIITEPCNLSGLLDRYFQYRVSLETDDPSSTPTLHDVALNWDPMGIEGSEDPSIPALLPFSPNPSSLPVVRFRLHEPSLVELSIFDLSGRLVSKINRDEYSPGYHDVLLGEFSPGVYFCSMTSGDFTATQRFIIIQ